MSDVSRGSQEEIDRMLIEPSGDFERDDAFLEAQKTLGNWHKWERDVAARRKSLKTQTTEKLTSAVESVNHPSHYNQGKIEVIDFIQDQKLDFCLGNAIKYICRAQHKGKAKEDIAKAIWYLQNCGIEEKN
jgi:hypothetical protein